MDQMSFVPRVPPVPQPAEVSFTGDRGEFRRLVTRGALLELVTVGFYRFWLATDMRRHLWSNTSVDGDPAEYTGTGKELLIGFLFALAIVVPIYLVYFVISLEAERLAAFASFPLLAFFYVFGQFAIYRARRYRLTRTVWRGVRFWMDGSGWVYAGRATLWALLMGLTLGLVLPWREAALERYKMRHSYYGDLQGSFEGRGGQLFKRAWWLWLLAPVVLVVFPLIPFAYAAFKAIELRWWLSGVRFGDVRFRIVAAKGRSDRLVLEGDRLGSPADGGHGDLCRPVHVRRGQRHGTLARQVLCCIQSREEHSVPRSSRRGIPRLRAGYRRRDAGVSDARSLGAGRDVDLRAQYRGGRQCDRRGRSGQRTW